MPGLALLSWAGVVGDRSLWPNVRPAQGQHDDLAGLVDCGSADQLLTAGRTVVSLDQTEVLVVRTRRGIFAVENRCPHAGRPLDDARVAGRRIECRGHGRRFDLESGCRLAGRPEASGALRTYTVVVARGRLWLAPRDDAFPSSRP